MGSPQLLDLGSGFNNKGTQSFSCSKLKLDSLFVQWLSLPTSQQLVLQLLEDVKAGRTVGTGSPKKKLSITHTHAFSSATGTPPIFIPQFYFPSGGSASVQRAALSKVDAFFAVYPQGLSLDNLKALLKQVFSLPTSLAYPLFYKMAPGDEGLVPRAALVGWLDATSFWSKDAAARAFEILCAPGVRAVLPADLKPVLAGILISHPGLEFLVDSPEFQERYAETVIHRIFYSLNRSGTGRLSLRELRRGDLLEALQEVDAQDDINRVTRYFSYEHFYVIYCKFWDLDTDHDFRLSRDDLLRYGSHALTFRIVERIFSQVPRSFSTGDPGAMGYEDFVWFILSEEDKTTDTSLEYWFRCCDLDGDERLHSSELYYFYEEQLHRMECLSQESVSFFDVMGQLHDMLNPEHREYYTMRDLRRNRQMAGMLFNVLFNLNKFVQFETRDPFTARQEREEVGVSEWDRFARNEYMRLSMEDEADADGADATASAWAADALAVEL